MQDPYISVSLTQCTHPVMIVSQYGWSELMWAAYSGRTEVVAQLLDAGANTDLLSEVCTLSMYTCICVSKLYSYMLWQYMVCVY